MSGLPEASSSCSSTLVTT